VQTCTFCNLRDAHYLAEMTLLSEAYRAYALICEQRARDAADPIAKLQWEQTAKDWHQMAHSIADADDDIDPA
jgi:hypothetical protein